MINNKTLKAIIDLSLIIDEKVKLMNSFNDPELLFKLLGFDSSYTKHIIDNYKDLYDINSKHINCTVLFYACQKDYNKIVKVLLTHPSINVNSENGMRDRTALMIACYSGRYEIVEMLLNIPNIDINTKDNMNDTALIDACDRNHTKIVEMLLKYPGIETKSAYEYCIRYDKTELAKLINSDHNTDQIINNVKSWTNDEKKKLMNKLTAIIN